jgi:leader peptidase (prepilin peptidase)/N-methyltransferase
MSCNHPLAWYDLFPLFSYLSLRGKCRYCKAKISKQYPLVEFANGAMTVLCLVFGNFGVNTIRFMYTTVKISEEHDVFDWAASAYDVGLIFLNCILCSVLIVITVVDWRTFEIPIGTNVIILILGVVKLIALAMVDSRYYNMYCDLIGKTPSFWESLYARGRAMELIIGFFIVSVPLAIIYYVSKGKAIGGGDVKLMAVAGLFLGWKLALVALIAGCLYGSVIHIIRMKVSGEGKQLAMGPYLSAGIVTALWFGKDIVNWYSGFFR